MKHFWLFFASSFVLAVDVPNPLSLTEALSIGKNQSLEIQQQQLTIDASSIALKDAQSNFDVKVNLDLQLAKRDDYDERINNTHAFVRLEKTLFEQSAELAIDVAKQNVTRNKQNLTYLQKEKNITIMRHFFDVILVDMQLETTLEKLAISAIRANHVQDDFDINKAAEVTLLEKRAITQLDVSKRIQIEAQQILTRAKLADILGISYENRPDDLTTPKLEHYFSKPIGSLEKLRKKALENNRELQTIQSNLSALKHQINHQKNDLGLVVKGNVRLGEQGYLRDKNGELRFGINLTLPLGNNDAQQRTIKKLVINAEKAKLDIQQFKQNLSTQVLSLWQTLNTLKQVQQSLITELDYRDLYLERARAYYEMELESDIGDALTQFTNTEYELTKNTFDFVIAFEQLALLTGETP